MKDDSSGSYSSDSSIPVEQQVVVDDSSESEIEQKNYKISREVENVPKSVAAFLISNNMISNNETVFPISAENLIVYLKYLKNRVLTRKIAKRTLERYIGCLKRYHSQTNLSLDAFSNSEFIELNNPGFNDNEADEITDSERISCCDSTDYPIRT